MKGLRFVNYECEEHLIVFKDAGHAEKVLQIIHELDKGIAIRNQEVMNVKQYQDWWVTGTITNGEYLFYLNFVANRSFNDLTQYPVFPWVIADYKNSHIDFEKGGPFVYRDLGKPIGALN
jgi:factor associated with neutral sphingomyelinase activation